MASPKGSQTPQNVASAAGNSLSVARIYSAVYFLVHCSGCGWSSWSSAKWRRCPFWEEHWRALASTNVSCRCIEQYQYFGTHFLQFQKLVLRWSDRPLGSCPEKGSVRARKRNGYKLWGRSPECIGNFCNCWESKACIRDVSRLLHGCQWWAV
jgi:hypothetical protein